MQPITFPDKIRSFFNFQYFLVKIQLHTFKIWHFDKKNITIVRGVCRTPSAL